MKKLLKLAVASLLLAATLVGCTVKPYEGPTEIELLSYDTGMSGTIVEFLAQEWGPMFEEYGITFNIKKLPFQQKLDTTKAGDYDISFSGWGPDYDWPTTYLDMWKSTNTYNEIGYNNPDYDKLMDAEGKDDAKIWEDLQKAEKLLLEDAYFIPMYQRAGRSLMNPELKDIVHNLSGVEFVYKWTYKTDGSFVNLLETEKMPSMDPALATDTISFGALGNVNEGLVRQGKVNGTYEPGVATEWTFDEATLTWTFKLRTDANWVDHTGAVVRPVVAQDFKDSWDRLIDPATAAQYAFLYADVAQIKEVTVVSDTELKVVLNKKVPYIESIMAFGSFTPINKEFVDAQGAKFGTTKETTLYNGPFYMSTWDHTSRVVWTKNENYWDKASVKAPGINFRVIEGYEVKTGVSLFEAGEIDRVGLSGEFIAQFATDPRVVKVFDTAVFYLMLNVANAGVTDVVNLDPTAGHPLLDNANIRKALALGFDKTYITDQILKNGSVAANFFVPGKYLAWNGVAFEAARGDGYMLMNKEEAMRLLEKGMKELGVKKVTK